MNNRYLKGLVLVAAVAVGAAPLKAQTTQPAPRQDAGLPYTRSARPVAVARITDDIAVFPGSRYAYVRGRKVRLDDVNWKAEALERNGVLYVPAAFASVLAGTATVQDVPAGLEFLKDRWVYGVDRPSATVDGARQLTVDGADYLAAEDLATAAGLSVVRSSRGVWLAGKSPKAFTSDEATLEKAVVTLFDTPEKYADPSIATEFVPRLAEQGDWTRHVRVTPEQLAVLNGPETKWAFTPVEKFDFTGFNRTLLGSAVPPPGVYPRILFSEADVPMLAARLKGSQLGQKSLIEVGQLLKGSFLDPKTSDGQVFEKLAEGGAGRLEGLGGLEWPEIKEGQAATDVPQQFKGQKPGIYSSHVAYVPEALTTLALYCLLTGDDETGKKTATAIANYYRLREPLVDEWLAVSDSEFGSQYVRPDGKPAYPGGSGSTTHWRNLHGIVAHMNFGLALDFAGKWMSDADKSFMQHLIAKATYGRRAYGQDGPVRFRDVNWVSWDLPNFLALLAIEGLPGCDPEALASNRETVRAFCEFGIDRDGVVYESNGKTGGGFQFLTLSMIAIARRDPAGPENLFGHPHLRKLLEGQIQMTSPDGRVVVNSGTQYVPYSQQRLTPQFVDELKAFFPQDRRPDYLLGNIVRHGDEEALRFWKLDPAFDPVRYAADVPRLKRLRMSSPTYPSFVRSFLYDADYVPTTRADLKLPLTFSAPVHGVFSAYSDESEMATWVNLMVRPDHYLGAGHHHADAGQFHVSALGVNWITESPFPGAYAGRLHNQVLIDGKSESDVLSSMLSTSYQAAGKYLGATVSDAAAFASADLTESYTWQWQTQPGPVWANEPQAPGTWELDPSPQLREIFAGTARYKMRPWWPTANFSNYIATSRRLFNPVEYAYRTVGLVRGEPARGGTPFVVIADDVKKDDAVRLYEWTASLSGGVWAAAYEGLGRQQLVLACREPAGEPDLKTASARPALVPEKGEPLLLVTVLTPEVPKGELGAAFPLVAATRVPGVVDKAGAAQFYDRLTVSHRGTQGVFRIVLTPFRAGEPLPAVSYDAKAGTATVNGKTVVFASDGKRTVVRVPAEAARQAAGR